MHKDQGQKTRRKTEPASHATAFSGRIPLGPSAVLSVSTRKVNRADELHDVRAVHWHAMAGSEHDMGPHVSDASMGDEQGIEYDENGKEWDIRESRMRVGDFLWKKQAVAAQRLFWIARRVGERADTQARKAGDRERPLIVLQLLSRDPAASAHARLDGEQIWDMTGVGRAWRALKHVSAVFRMESRRNDLSACLRVDTGSCAAQLGEDVGLAKRKNGVALGFIELDNHVLDLVAP